MSEQQKSTSLPRVRPATDILEREDGFHIIMDLPGVKKEDLVIDLKENDLLISGKAEYGFDEAKNLIVVEFGSGEYMRSFTLSDIVDREKIKASMDNGVLEIHMPRKEKATPKRIEIQAG